MNAPHRRYFIELQPLGQNLLPRNEETVARREAAADFIAGMRAWLTDEDMAAKVSGIAITLFGQVQISCDSSVINTIRAQDVMPIAAIRQGNNAYGEILHRWSAAG